MAVTQQKRGRGRPPKNTKKAETKKKVEKLLEGIPLTKKTEETKPVAEKPKPKDNDMDFVLEQLDAANIKIAELEEQVIQYKASYEKLLNSNKGNPADTDAVGAKVAHDVQSFFDDLVRRDQSRAQFGGAVVKLNYNGQGSKGILQEMLQRFPFIKG